MSRIPHTRFLIFLAIFALASLALSLRLQIEAALILGFDLAALVFLGSALPLWRADTLDAARARAARDDGGRGLLLLVSVAVLGVILLSLGRLAGEKAGHGGGFALIAGTLVLAWLFANLIFAFHYGHLYYDQKGEADAGGIDFPEGESPDFADFTYFAFTIGMTCQTADLSISSKAIRRTVTLHGLFAFFFNLGVLAFAVNVLAGLI